MGPDLTYYTQVSPNPYLDVFLHEGERNIQYVYIVIVRTLPKSWIRGAWSSRDEEIKREEGFRLRNPFADSIEAGTDAEEEQMVLFGSENQRRHTLPEEKKKAAGAFLCVCCQGLLLSEPSRGRDGMFVDEKIYFPLCVYVL